MPSEGPSRPYNWRRKSLAKLKLLLKQIALNDYLTIFVEANGRRIGR